MNGDVDDPPPVERLIEAALFAPLDLTARVVQEIPFAVEKTKRQLVFARFIGKMAVDQGVAELQRRITGNGSTAPAASPAPSDDDVDTVDHDGPPDGEVAVVDEPVVDEPVAAGEDELALPDYDHLPATHIVAKLAGLSQGERNVIEAYERAHRNRRTVLGKLDQLREG